MLSCFQTAVQENAEQYNNELERLQKVVARTEEEKRKKCEELSQVSWVVRCENFMVDFH